MADEADNAQPHIDAAVADAIERARRAERLPPIGECHACATFLRGKQLFCDSECREDWEYFAQRDHINRKRR